jgi:hypothetical protein
VTIDDEKGVRIAFEPIRTHLTRHKKRLETQCFQGKIKERVMGIEEEQGS